MNAKIMKIGFTSLTVMWVVYKLIAHYKEIKAFILCCDVLQ